VKRASWRRRRRVTGISFLLCLVLFAAKAQFHRYDLAVDWDMIGMCNRYEVLAEGVFNIIDGAIPFFLTAAILPRDVVVTRLACIVCAFQMIARSWNIGQVAKFGCLISPDETERCAAWRDFNGWLIFAGH
jgi:hypothetical protein